VRDTVFIEHRSNRHSRGETPAGPAKFFTRDPVHPNLSLT
jgi:hypothetical protein